MNISKETFKTPDGLTNYSFTLGPKDNLDAFTVIASRRGVTIQGKVELDEIDHLNSLAKVIADAWKEHRKLQPKISSTLSGH